MKKNLKIFFFLLIIFSFVFSYHKRGFSQSCSDYGGICTDVSLCGSENGEMFTNTECDSKGEICCVPFAPPTSNDNSPSQNTGLIIENPLSPISDIWQLIMRLINIAQNIGVFVCVILIVWAGYLYVTSAGNEEKIKQAQKTLIWALVGFGIIVIAGAVPKLIYEFITGKSWESLYNQEETNSEYYSEGLGENELYPASEPVGGMSYNASTNECYFSEYVSGNDPECEDDLLI